MSLDLGSGFSLRFSSWAPDRKLNPQYKDLPDVEKIGAIITCKHGIEGSILFDHGPKYSLLFPHSPKWTVESWEPLTLSPSIDAGCCHGYIRKGKWEE